jgi:hypothetical protein
MLGDLETWDFIRFGCELVLAMIFWGYIAGTMRAVHEIRDLMLRLVQLEQGHGTQNASQQHKILLRKRPPTA